KGVDEPRVLARAGDREAGLEDAPPVDRAGRPEPPSRLQAGPGPPDGHGAGEPDVAQLLRVALVVAPDQREVLVHPDVDAAAVVLALVPAPDHDEALLVLGAHRVQEL